MVTDNAHEMQERCISCLQLIMGYKNEARRFTTKS